MTWLAICFRPYLKEDEAPTSSTSSSSTAPAAAPIAVANDVVTVRVPAALTVAAAAAILSEGLALILGEAPASDEPLVAAGIDSLTAVEARRGRCCPPRHRHFDTPFDEA
jgi:hypothetical protein